jgi:hypothetical protein
MLQQAGLLDGTGLSAAGRALREGIEATTDVMEQPIVGGVGADFEPVVEQLTAWSARCIAAGAFPLDVYKRAAG